MRRLAGTAVGLVVVTSLLAFITYTFHALAHPPPAAPATPPAEAPVKVYGFVEPAGREVFISVPKAKRIVAVFVVEGKQVAEGQKMLSLESSVEAAQLEVSLARVEVLRKTVLLSAEELSRTKRNLEVGGATEDDYVSARLRHDINEASLSAVLREAGLNRAALEELTLRSPVDGVVYKLDVRLGETIVPEDRTSIILGPAELHVRLFLESFWIGRIEPGASLEVFDMETDKPLGTGKILSFSRYLGAKRIRTEDPVERQDTKYQEVTLSLDPRAEDIPIGLPVYVTLRE